MTNFASGDFAIGDDRTTPNRRQSIPTIAGPECIPAEVHDTPAVTRRAVGADAYRRQQHPESIAAALRASVERDRAVRLEVVRAMMVEALDLADCVGPRADSIVDLVMGAQIKAGRL